MPTVSAKKSALAGMTFEERIEMIRKMTDGVYDMTRYLYSSLGNPRAKSGAYDYTVGDKKIGPIDTKDIRELRRYVKQELNILKRRDVRNMKKKKTSTGEEKVSQPGALGVVKINNEFAKLLVDELNGLSAKSSKYLRRLAASKLLRAVVHQKGTPSGKAHNVSNIKVLKDAVDEYNRKPENSEKKIENYTLVHKDLNKLITVLSDNVKYKELTKDMQKSVDDDLVTVDKRYPSKGK